MRERMNEIFLRILLCRKENVMKKIFLLILSLFFFLTGCEDLAGEANDILTGLYDDYCKTEEILLCAEIDMKQELLEENGQSYYALSEKYECTSVLQLKDLLEKVYTKDKVQQLMESYVNDESGIFKEIDGKLGRVLADAPVTDFKIPVTRAEKVNENEIVVQTVDKNDASSQIKIRLQKQSSGWRIAEVFVIK